MPQVRQVFVRDQSGDRLEITLGTPDAKLSGEEVAVPVTVKGFNEISSLQFSLEWDPTKIRLIKEVENGTYGPKMTNIHSQIGGVTTNPIAPGKLVIVWFSINSDGETISDTEKLFDLHFNLVGDPGESSAISLVNDPVPYRVGTGSNIPVHETAVNGTVSIANLRYFGGEVRYLGLEDHLVSDVNVYVSQQDGGSFDLTDAEGRYEVMVNPDEVTGVKADAEGFYVQDGVDVLDITKVGQHIALSIPFSLPQEYVAADVNRDYTVDALDLSAMLDVALGNEKFFSKEDNWRFVDPAFLKTNAETAMFNISRYEELVIPAGLEGNKSNAHLAAIRLGDVDGSLADQVGPYSARAATPASLALSNNFEFGGMALNEEGELEVAVHGRFEDGIMGVQFDLNWDPATLQLEGLSAPQLSGFDESRHFSLREGEGTLLWFEPRFGSAAIDGESPVVSLRFSLVEGATQGTMIHLSKPKIVHGSGQGGTIEMTSVYVSEEALGLEIASALPEGTQRVTEFTTPGPVKSFAFSSEGVSLDFATTPGVSYVIERADDLLRPVWYAVGTITGSGQMASFSEPPSEIGAFYRVRELPPGTLQDQ